MTLPMKYIARPRYEYLLGNGKRRFDLRLGLFETHLQVEDTFAKAMRKIVDNIPANLANKVNLIVGDPHAWHQVIRYLSSPPLTFFS